ncbi:MAG: redoxin domain-containing protein [Myxococcota bacterium]|jgi:peroxiredoxin|nr:redoxin domain-containing protein [Myxococcota bacterium]
MSLLGQPAPDFRLHDTTCTPVDLVSYRGHRLVIAFFPAAFTGVCQKEMCTLQSTLESLGELDAHVVGISVDAAFSNAAFRSANHIEFPLLSDYTRATVRAYGVALENFAGMSGYTVSQRAVFIIDEKGTVTYEWIAPNPGVEPNYREVQGALA